MDTQLGKNRNGQINIVLQGEKQVKAENSHSFHPVKKNNPFKHIEQEFSTFIAMNELKDHIKEIYATIVVNEKRKALGLTNSKQVLHMLFKGNPGTGKTTVARKLAKIYYDMNILSKGHFIEAERADLVGEYIGQTAQKTKSMIQKAMGGILFIDEAYSLGRGGEKDFGKEAIDTLVKHMEDNQNDLVLILAGYPNEMERFLALNPGLESRFPFILDFEDYEVHQLIAIAEQMVAQREYKFTKEAKWILKDHLYKKTHEKKRNFSNARYIRNIIERAIRIQAYRLVQTEQFSSEHLIHITASDLRLDN